MQKPPDFKALSCSECRDADPLDFQFTMAFQPIVNLAEKNIFAYEALVRGPENQSAGEVFTKVNAANRYSFDQSCRVKAIALAARLGMRECLSINFMPNAVYRPELCIRTTLAAAEEYDFPVERIIFEVTEGERVEDHLHLRQIVDHYQQQGFTTAIDDFGAGFAGLNLLAEFDADLIKIDMGLIRDIDRDKKRQAIVKGVLQVCRDLNRRVIAEGIETREELEVLQAFGVELCQGYYFARPAFEALPEVAGFVCGSGEEAAGY